MLPFSFKLKFNFESPNKKEEVFKEYLNDWKNGLEDKKVKNILVKQESIKVQSPLIKHNFHFLQGINSIAVNIKELKNNYYSSEVKVMLSPMIFIILIGLIVTPFFNLDLLKFSIIGIVLFGGVNIGIAFSRISALAEQINKYYKE